MQGIPGPKGETGNTGETESVVVMGSKESRVLQGQLE